MGLVVLALFDAIYSCVCVCVCGRNSGNNFVCSIVLIFPTCLLESSTTYLYTKDPEDLGTLTVSPHNANDEREGEKEKTKKDGEW